MMKKDNKSSSGISYYFHGFVSLLTLSEHNILKCFCTLRTRFYKIRIEYNQLLQKTHIGQRNSLIMNYMRNMIHMTPDTIDELTE